MPHKNYSDNFSTYAVSKLPSVRDDFSTDNWVDNDSAQIGVSGGVLNFNFTRDNTDDSSTRDLGAGNVSNERWVLQFHLTVNTLTSPSTGTLLGIIGLSDSITTGAQDFIGMMIVRTSGGATSYRLISTNNVDPVSGVDSAILSTVPTTSDNYYIEIKRLSASRARITIFSDSAYSLVVERKDFDITGGGSPITSNINGLRYLKLQNIIATGGGSIAGTIDDIELFSGAQIGAVTIQDDFSSGANWTTTDSGVVNVGSGLLNFNLTQNGGNKTIARDLGSGFVNAIRWLLRFKINFSSITDQAQAIIGLSSTDQATNFGTGAQDSLQVEFGALTGANAVYLFYNQGIGRISAGSISFDYTTGADYYVELIRTDDAKATLRLYSDSNFTELIGSLNNATIGSGVTSLRYIKVGNVALSIDTGNHTGTIDNLEFYNNVIVSKSPLKSIPELDFPFNSATGWVQTGTGVSVNTTTQQIEGWSTDGAIDKRVTYDMGSDRMLNESDWTVEFEYEFSASSSPAHAPLVISNNNQNTDLFGPVLSDDVIGIAHGITLDQLGIYTKDNLTATFSTDVIPIVVNTRYYVRLERIRDTTVKLSVFSDPDFTQHIASSPIFLTIASTIDSLRYIHSENLYSGSVLRTLSGVLDNLKVYRTQRGTEKDNKWLVIG